MGDRVTSFEDCPKCGEGGALECYEQLSSCLKVDSCTHCDFVRRYDVTDENYIIKIYELDEKGNRIIPEPQEPEPTVKEMIASLTAFVIEEFGELNNRIDTSLKEIKLCQRKIESSKSKPRASDTAKTTTSKSGKRAAT